MQVKSLFIHHRATIYWQLVKSKIVHWTRCLQGEETHCQEPWVINWQINGSIWLLKEKQLPFLIKNKFCLTALLLRPGGTLHKFGQGCSVEDVFCLPLKITGFRFQPPK